MDRELEEAKRTSDTFWACVSSGPTRVISGNSSDCARFQKIKATNVVIKGYEELDLLLHRPADSKSGWNISEGRSGAIVIRHARTQKEAKEQALALLLKRYPHGMHDARSMEDTIKGWINTYGISPRYVQFLELGDAEDG